MRAGWKISEHSLIDQLRQAWKPDAKFGVTEALAILKPQDPVVLGTTLSLRTEWHRFWLELCQGQR